MPKWLQRNILSAKPQLFLFLRSQPLLETKGCSNDPPARTFMVFHGNTSKGRKQLSSNQFWSPTQKSSFPSGPNHSSCSLGWHPEPHAEEERSFSPKAVGRCSTSSSGRPATREPWPARRWPGSSRGRTSPACWPQSGSNHSHLLCCLTWRWTQGSGKRQGWIRLQKQPCFDSELAGELLTSGRFHSPRGCWIAPQSLLSF